MLTTKSPNNWLEVLIPFLLVMNLFSELALWGSVYDSGSYIPPWTLLYLPMRRLKDKEKKDLYTHTYLGLLITHYLKHICNYGISI